jgi:hypothetical protein
MAAAKTSQKPETCVEDVECIEFAAVFRIVVAVVWVEQMIPTISIYCTQPDKNAYFGQEAIYDGAIALWPQAKGAMLQ